MKKHVKRSLVSLILCATMSCVIGAFAAMSSFKAKAEAEYQTLEHFTIKEEAAVRTKDFNGIRFKTELSDDAKAEIDSLNLGNAQYGTLILPADLLGSEELTHDTAKVVDIKTTKWQDETTYTSVLAGVDAKGNYTDLPESYYNRPLAARSYVKGENGVTYYSKNTTVRSIGYVAYMAQLLDNNNTPLINKIVKGTKVEFVFNNKQISAIQNTDGGAAVVDNTIPQSTTEAASIKVGGVALSDEVVEKLVKKGKLVNTGDSENVEYVTYTTDNSDVISVDGEELTAKSRGKATVKATATFNGTEYTATKEISTEGYYPKSEYKILISKEVANAPLNSATYYLPAQSVEAHNAYANAYEKTAAYKLQEILEEVTGLKLPIVTNVETGVKYISVGHNTSLVPDKFTNGLKATDAKVQAINDNVIICGGGQEGTLYGVQSWLGELVGYEYYTNNIYSVNEKVVIVAPSEAKTYTRDITYNVTQPENLDYHAGSDALDGYGMRSYTEEIIPLGITEDEEKDGYYYKGIAHNSVLVLQGEGAAQGYKEADVSGTERDGIYDYTWTGRNGTPYALGANTYDNKFDNGHAIEDTITKHWYATYTKTYTLDKKPIYFGSTSTSNPTAGEFYHVMLNPYYNAKATEGLNSYQYIKAELCYTAHGNSDSYVAMVDAVAQIMYNQMQKFPAYDRIGFAQMDHAYWCQCSTCVGHGNASANLLEFLLDVAAKLKEKLGSDPRAGTFQICTLFYHDSNPNPGWTTEPTAKLEGYMKHIEVWFAETGADQIDPYNLAYSDTTADEISKNNNGNDWNTKVYGFMEKWAELCKKYGSDMLWWGYYANTISQFIPFNTIDAMRYNYKTASELGVDTMFNQMMTFQTNWSGLKYYLMSKLTDTAYELDASGNEVAVSNETWNGWINDYFEHAYGDGAEAMKEYYESWHQTTNDNKDLYRRNSSYQAYQDDGQASQAAMTLEARGFDIVVNWDESTKTYSAEIVWNTTWDNVWSQTTLESWIESCNNALGALDVSDANYETYYNNIMLEKLVPMYLLMFKLDKYTPVLKTMIEPYNYVIDYDKDGSFTTTDQVRKYGSEFLTWATKLNVTQDGEDRSLTPFLNAIKSAGAATFTTTIVDDLIIAEANTTVTLYSAALKAGEYTVSGTESGKLTTATSATVSTDGQVPIDVGNLEFGKKYNVTFTDDAGNKVTFNNVMVASGILDADAGADKVSGSDGYYFINKTYYIEEGETEITLTHNVLTKYKDDPTYTVTANNNTTNATVFYAGRLNVNITAMSNGEQCFVYVKDKKTNNTYVFNVLSAKFIRTVEELQALGVGGRITTSKDETTGVETKTYWGNANSDESGKDVTGLYVLANDIDCAGVVFAAGYNRDKSYFKATIDGNGYTLWNVSVNEGGIFGGMWEATVKNMKFKNVQYIDEVGQKYGEAWSNYTALFAHVAQKTTFKNIEIFVTKAPTQVNYELLEGLFVAANQDGTVYEDITVNAHGVNLMTALGSNMSGAVYRDVVINAAKVHAMGYTATEFAVDENGDAVRESNQCVQNTTDLLAEWPAGVHFETVTENPNTYAIWNMPTAYVSNTEIMPFYAGDVTALGFKEGTLVQYAVQDNRTGNWDGGQGTNLGLTMADQAMRFTKTDAAADYASVQFALSRDMTASDLFFAWCYNASNDCTMVTVSKSTGNGISGDITVRVYNLDGTPATDIEAGKAYEMRLYVEGAYKFEIGCMEANGQPITMYWANLTNGNEDVLSESVVALSQTVTTTEANGVATATFTTAGQTTLDVSGVREIVGNQEITMTLGGSLIHTGTLTSDTLSLDSSLFTGISSANIVIKYNGGWAYLPIRVESVIELDQDNAGSPLKLQAILNTNPNGQYILTTNLDMSGSPLKGVKTFNGILDGNGHMITNTALTFDANPDMGYAPVFIATNNGTIKNIGFELNDYVWHAGSSDRGITAYNFGTISNVYVTVTLNTALNSGANESITGGAPNLDKFNAVGILGRENAGSVENCIVDIITNVELDNNTVAGLFYKNHESAKISNSIVITSEDYIETTWIEAGTANNATKYADWSAVDTDAITSSNGWSDDVWFVDAEGSVYFGDVCLHESVVITGGTISATDKPEDLTVYSGNVSDLGFAADTTVYQAQISNGWSSRVQIAPNDLKADFVSFDFTVSTTVTQFNLWPSSGGSYAIDANGIYIPANEVGKADTITIVIYDQNGNLVDKGPWVPSTIYTVKVYLQGETARLTHVEFSTFEAGCSIYLANITSGYDFDRVTVDLGLAVSGTVVTRPATTTLDLSEVASRLNGQAVTIQLNSDVIYEGTISGDSVTLETSKLTVCGENDLVITYAGDEKIYLPVYIDDTIELNQDNAGTPDNLKMILGSKTDGHFVLTSNLNMGGNYLKSIETFSGILDGNGYGIINTYISYDGDTDGDTTYSPNFIYTSTGTMRNIYFQLSNFGWSTDADKDKNFVGNDDQGIICNNLGTIENVYVGITLKYPAVESKQRGLLVKKNDGTIRNVVVDVRAINGVTLVENTIAAVAYHQNGTVENAYVVTNNIPNLFSTMAQPNPCIEVETVSDLPLDTIRGWVDSWSNMKVVNGEIFFGDTNWGLYNTELFVPYYSETKTALSEYSGDATAMGFAADDVVYEVVSTDVWNNRINVGNSTYAEYLVFDFAMTNPGDFTVWFARNHAMVNGHSFVVHTNGNAPDVNEGGIANTFFVVDQDGNQITSQIQANKKYTMYVHLDGEVDIDGIIMGADANFYIANVHACKDELIYTTDKGPVLPIYTGDVTKLGFAEGTTVQYKTDEYDLVGGSDNWWRSGTVEINGEILDCSNNGKRQVGQPVIYADADYNVVCIEFALSEAVASGSVFHVWAYDEAKTHLGGGVVSVGQAWAESGFAGAIYDKDGNIATSLEANTVYVLKLRVDGAYRYNFANIVESAMTVYYSGIISYEN